MKSNKILAKVLAAAVVVTSILPGSLTAQAAPKIQTETTSQWMYTNAETKKFTMSQENWLDAETDEMFDTFGRTLYVGEGLQTWQLESSESDANDNRHAYDQANAPACVYAKNVDISSQPGSRRVMRFVLYPPVDSVQDQGIRFGIMLKYVDADHWAFLGFNGKWYIQWMNGESNAGYAQSDEGSYVKTDGTTQDKWVSDIQSIKPADEQFLRVTVIYEDKTHIRIRLAPCEGTIDEDGNDILNEKTDNEGNSLAKEDTLDFKVFGDLRDYADGEEGSTPKPIHLGFVAGTDQQQLSSNDPAAKKKAITRMSIVNVMKGALYPASTEGKTDDDYKEPLELISYPDCGWTSPKGTNAETILAPGQTGDGATYASIGKKATEGTNNDSFDATIYNKTITNFEKGTVSGTLRPYTVGVNKEFSIGIMATQNSQDAHSNFKIGINNNKWVYSLDGGQETEITGSDLPVIESKKDYNISMTIDDNSKLTATVSYTVEKDDSEEQKTATLIGANNAVDVKGLSGAVCLSTKGEILRVKDIVCMEVTSDSTPLEKKYEELKDKNAEYIYYNDVWNTFESKLTAAKNALDGSNAVLTTDSTEYANFNDAKAAELQSAFTAIDKNENKVATGKAELQTAYNAVKDIDLTTDTYTKYYTADSIKDFGDARDAVETFLEGMDADGFTGVDKTEISTKKSSISLDSLVAKEYTKAEAAEAVDAELKKVLENEDGTAKYDEANGAKYYDNWEDFADALQAVRALKESENVTVAAVDEAIAALNTAAAKLTDKMAADEDKAALTTAVSGIESAVAAKKYAQDENWNAYTKALQDAKDAAANANSTVKDLDAVLAKLQAAQAALKEEVSGNPPAGGDQNTDQGPKKGDVKTVGNATYTIVDPAAATVTLKTGDKKAKNANINTVKIDGKTYKVIRIGKNAFANSKTLKSVTIGKNVKSIQANAFKKCTKLKKVTFKGTDVSSIAKNSFKGSKVTTVKVPKKLKKNTKFLNKVKKAGIKVKKLS